MVLGAWQGRDSVFRLSVADPLPQLLVAGLIKQPSLGHAEWTLAENEARILGLFLLNPASIPTGLF